ncbi:MAG: Fe-S cluster assembly protein HesB [Planctomycetota bacterium]
MPRATLSMPVPKPFDLRLCLFGHGWIDLPPHGWDEDANEFTTVLATRGGAVDATVRQPKKDALAVRLDSGKKLAKADVAAAGRALAHMLRLDDDLGAFHALCRREPRLAWAARRGGGRLLRSACVFDDLMKLLFTTNTTWSGTKAMTQKLVDTLGEAAPSGRRAFPTAAACVQDEAFYRDTVRTGYRAKAATALARAFADGALDDAAFLAPQPAIVLWKRLLALHGFGPYAAGQAMRLCGNYVKLALDSWCRARLCELDGTKKPPKDKAVEKRYAPFAPFQGLALWLDLTAEWHGEGR